MKLRGATTPDPFPMPCPDKQLFICLDPEILKKGKESQHEKVRGFLGNSTFYKIEYMYINDGNVSVSVNLSPN